MYGRTPLLLLVIAMLFGFSLVFSPSASAQEPQRETNIVNHGLIAPRDREAALIERGMTPQQAALIMKQDAAIRQANSAGLSSVEMERMMADFDRELTELSRSPASSLGGGGFSVFSTRNIVASCTNGARGDFTYNGATTRLSEIVRHDGHTYQENSNCAGFCVGSHKVFVPHSYEYNRVYLGGTGPWFNSHSAGCL